MSLIGINLTSQSGLSSIRAINCGTSSPKLSGTIDVSAFPNLQEFRCNYNDITALSGYESNSNLQLIHFFNNKVTGSIPTLNGLTNLREFFCFDNMLTSIPSLTGLINLRDFNCLNNQITGSIPTLSGLNNLQFFRCQLNQFTGPIPNLTGLNNLRVFHCQQNQITGSIPSLIGSNSLELFSCRANQLTGSIPSLNGLTNLREFFCFDNMLTSSIPSLTGLTNLRDFNCVNNQITGSIPTLSGLNNLQFFRCSQNQLSSFDGGPVSVTLSIFEAQNNQLNQSSINAILSAFVVANRTTGTRILNVGGTGNAAPSYTGGVTTTSPGTNFTRSGTTVTANVNSHGHVNGDIVTITGITPTAFQGTFVVTRITDNQFQYTTLSSGAATGTGTATMRKTSDATSGYASYQNLALVSRTGGPWTITINQP